MPLIAWALGLDVKDPRRKSDRGKGGYTMAKKKILFVYPSTYDENGRLVKSGKSLAPSRTLPYLAALTSDRFETRIIDEAVQDVDFDVDIDMVALTGMINHMPRAMDIAAQFRRRNVTAMIGGVGAYSIRDVIAASGVFDCHVIGEVEAIWEGILEDFERGQLQPIYQATESPGLDGLPHARFDLLDDSRYLRSFVDSSKPLALVETSRGCPNNCKYCLVTRYFGRKMRYRPVGDVVGEIKRIGARHVMFTDDNIAINPSRARELYEALKPLDIEWLGQFESSIVRQPELLQLAAESGCRTAFVGIESLDANALEFVNKPKRDSLPLREIAEGFKAANIIVMGSLMFGLDGDTAGKIAWTVEQMIAERIDTMIPWIFTPIPGTPLHEEYHAQGRILHDNYSLYDGVHAVHQPDRMSPSELEDCYWRGLRRFYRFRAIVPRVLRGKKGRIAELAYNLHVHRQVARSLHPFSGTPA